MKAIVIASGRSLEPAVESERLLICAHLLASNRANAKFGLHFERKIVRAREIDRETSRDIEERALGLKGSQKSCCSSLVSCFCFKAIVTLREHDHSKSAAAVSEQQVLVCV